MRSSSLSLRPAKSGTFLRVSAAALMVRSYTRLRPSELRLPPLFGFRLPAKGLGRQRCDLALVVDRDDEPLLGLPARDPPQDEVQRVPTHDHGLRAAPRLDPEPLLAPLCDVRVERSCADVCCAGG